MQLSTVRSHILITTVTYLFLVFFWKFLEAVGGQIPEDYHIYNIFSFVTPIAQLIFTPVILINRMFIKISMPLAFLVSSPIVETLAMQGIQKLAGRIIPDQTEKWKRLCFMIMRVTIIGLIFALGHKIPEYLHPTEYSRHLLHAGLYAHLLGGLIFAGFYEYSKNFIAVILLHSALNLANFLGFSTYVFTSTMNFFS